MTREHLASFAERLEQNRALQARLAELLGHPEADHDARALRELAAELGYDLSPDEARAAVAALRDEEGELDDERLALVAGGTLGLFRRVGRVVGGVVRGVSRAVWSVNPWDRG